MASCSDLATGYFVFELPTIENTALTDRMFKTNFNIYPNPVTNGNFRVTFPDNEYGQYSIQQIDLTGKIVSQKRVTVNMKAQTEEVKIGTQLTSGSYLVRIVNGSKNVASTNTLLLE